MNPDDEKDSARQRWLADPHTQEIMKLLARGVELYLQQATAGARPGRATDPQQSQAYNTGRLDACQEVLHKMSGHTPSIQVTVKGLR